MNLKEQYDIGFPIFENFFNMPSIQLKKTLMELCEDKLSEDKMLTISHGVAVKTITNDQPDGISIRYYGSSIDVIYSGIYYRPEHGDSRQIVSFDKHFKL